MKAIAIDTETTGLNPWQGARAFAVSMCDVSGHAEYMEWPVDPCTREVQPRTKDVEVLREICESKAVKVFFNAKFDIRMIEHTTGVKVQPPIEEVELMARVYNADDPKNDLKGLALSFLKYPKDDETGLQKAVVSARHIARNYLNWSVAGDTKADYWLPAAVARKDPERAKDGWRGICRKYAVGDAERTILLYLMYTKWFADNPSFLKTYEFERDLIPIVMEMEDRGVMLDVDYIENKCAEIEPELKRTERRLGFNPNSTQKLAAQMYGPGGWGLHPVRWTKSGNPSVDKHALEYYQDERVRRVYDYRQYQKLLSTYFLPYLRKQVDGVIHPSFRIMGARTGRLSCADPNLQNVSKKEGSVLALARVPFMPRPDYVWYLFDYMQIEARIFASDAEDDLMLESFREGRDVYEEMAQHVHDVADVPITRNQAKTVFLGIMYGEGRDLLSLNLGCGIDEAEAVLTGFDQAVPSARSYAKRIGNEAKQFGYITTIDGRQVPVDPDRSYAGVNYRIQGSAAGLLKRAMARMHPVVKRMGGHIVMSIHDEIVVELPLGKVTKQHLRYLKYEMEFNEGMFSIETPVDVNRVTRSWAEKTEVSL